MRGTATDLREALRKEVALWRTNPALFVRSVLGVKTLWQKQIEILERLDFPLAAQQVRSYVTRSDMGGNDDDGPIS